jgi:hypothetical protein
LDTRALADGVHRFAVGAEDIDGNRTVSGAYAVTIANAVRPNGMGSSRVARLSGRLIGGRTVAYGRTPRLAGRLADAAGRPIRRAALDVLERTRVSDAVWRAAGSTVTNDAGRFTIRLAKGPSRDVRVVYRALSSDPQPAAQLKARLTVRAGVRLRVGPHHVPTNGRIVFRGLLLGGPGRKGTQVTLYALDGARKIPVTVLKADRRGRFRFAYRFRRTFTRARFVFVARVDAQKGYPYAAGQSKRASVIVG